MAWRGTNSFRCFDAQNDHRAHPLLTHSDRTDSSTGAITRQTDRTGPAQWSRHCDRGWEVSPDDPCDTVGLTSPERLAALPVGTAVAPIPARVRRLRGTTSIISMARYEAEWILV